MDHGSGPLNKGRNEKSYAVNRLFRRIVLAAVGLLGLAVLALSCSSCSPIYVARAGWAEWKILSARRPLQEVIQDPSTDEATRRKLLLTRQARAFALHVLELDAGDSYTTFTRLESDTLAMILSAAYRDRLEPKTWWYPVVGRMPYKGFFDHEEAREARAELEAEGMDTYLRPTSAFSTLGWFSDPLLSTLLRYDDVELVETVLHELAHNHLWVPSHARFNESYATFVGRVGAIRFFCGVENQTPRRAECRQARERWAHYRGFSAFLDTFIRNLQELYARDDLTREEKVRARDELFQATREEHLQAGEPPEDLNPRVARFLSRPLNNAVLLSRMRYYHRLGDFQAFLEERGGDLAAAVRDLAHGAEGVENPFQLLPETGGAGDEDEPRG
mgnify:FL=1